MGKRVQIGRLDRLLTKLMKLTHDRCERCGDTKRMRHNHHFYGRRIHSLRWCTDNIFHLCSWCHVYSTDSAHESPEDFRNWAISERGEEWLHMLKQRKNQIKPDLDMIEKELKDEISSLGD